MADVFISYSRIDQPFVRKLFRALEMAKREAWVDWEGIPPTAKWLTEIYTAIDGADAFVFVLSPDSLASETCGKEVAHALETKKRIVPIVCRQVEAAQVEANTTLATLAALNWIFMRETDDFDAAFAHVRFALDTDLEYWHLSSRLLVRAKEWEGKGRGPGFTLGHKELNEAERWITQVANKQPTPSALQLEYISASRRHANNQQRRLLGGVSAAFVVTLVLAIISSLLFQTTRSQNTTIISKNVTLKSQNDALLVRAIAGDSSAALGSGRIDQAMLLAVEASQRQNSIDTRNSLVSSLEYTPYLDTILQGSDVASQNSGDIGRQVMFSHDGKTLLSTTRLGHITVWDVPTRKPRAQFTISCPTASGGTTHVIIGSALSPDGQLVATVISGCAQPSLDLWNANTGALVKHIMVPRFPSADISSGLVAFSPDSHEIAAPTCASTCASQFIQIWDTQSYQLKEQLPTSGLGSYYSLLFLSDGNHLAAVNRVSARIIDLTSQASVSLALEGLANFNIFTTALSPDDKILGLGGERCNPACTGQVLFVDVPSHKIISVATVNAGTIGVNGLAFSPDGHLAAVGANFQIALVDVANGNQIGPLLSGHSDAIRAIAFDPDGVHFASTAQDDQVLLWRTAPGLSVSNPSSADLDSSSLAALSPDGKEIATFNASNQVVIWNTATGAEAAKFTVTFSSMDAYLTTIAFGPDNNTVALGSNGASSADNVIRLWDIPSAKPIGNPFPLPQSIQDANQPGNILSFSPNGAYLIWSPGLSGFGRTVSSTTATWQVATRQPVLSVANASAVSFSSDGRFMGSSVTQNGSSRVQITDLTSNQVTQTLNGGPNAIVSLNFSHDGRSLASVDTVGMVTLWDLITGKADISFVGATSVYTGLYQVTFSSDGTLLMVTDGRTITFWDVAHKTLYLRPLVDAQTFNTALLSPDGQFFLEYENPGPLILRSLTVKGWQQQACTIANRNLTQAEWQQFIGNDAYHKTCPNLPAGN